MSLDRCNGSCYPKTRFIGPSCGVYNSGYFCTRPKGHEGDHIACAFNDKCNIGVWVDGEETLNIFVGKSRKELESLHKEIEVALLESDPTWRAKSND